MRPNGWQQAPLFDATSATPDFRAPIADLAPTAPPAFPQFPMLEEMQRHMRGERQHPLLQLSETAPPREPTSLFQGMLGGNLPVLVQDSIDHPERYDEETQLFLSELAAGTRKLEGMGPEDKAHLDRAVLDFASYKPRHRPPPAPPPQPFARARATVHENPYEPAFDDGRAPQVEAPGQTMSSYWWVRGDQV
jgi:hypothetical protein